MSIFVVRAFVRMREALAANQQILAKLDGREIGGPRFQHPRDHESDQEPHGSGASESPQNRIRAAPPNKGKAVNSIGALKSGRAGHRNLRSQIVTSSEGHDRQSLGHGVPEPKQQ